MHLRARQARVVKCGSNLCAFDGMDAEHGLRQPAIQLAIPLHMRAKAGRHAYGCHFKDSAQRVLGQHHVADVHAHQFGSACIRAAHIRRLCQPAAFGHRHVRNIRCHRTNLKYVAANLNSKLLQKFAADCRSGNARCRLAR